MNIRTYLLKNCWSPPKVLYFHSLRPLKKEAFRSKHPRTSYYHHIEPSSNSLQTPFLPIIEPFDYKEEIRKTFLSNDKLLKQVIKHLLVKGGCFYLKIHIDRSSPYSILIKIYYVPTFFRLSPCQLEIILQILFRFKFYIHYYYLKNEYNCPDEFIPDVSPKS